MEKKSDSENNKSNSSIDEKVEDIEEEEDDQRKIYEEQDNKKDVIINQMQEELRNTIDNLEGVRPQNTSLRSLDREVGGTEVDYEKIDRQTDMDQDVWDDHKPPEAVDPFERDDIKAFIHKKKKGKGRGGRKMGKMTLSQDQIEASVSSHVEKLKQSRANKNHKGQGGGMNI